MIYSLESLRGIAALLVAIGHFPLDYSFKIYFSYSYLMVDLFFCLSGFVIALNYSNKINDLNEFLDFNKKRILRVYPLHLFVLQLFLLIEFFKYLAEYRYGLVANNPAFEINNFTAYFSNLFLVQTFLDTPTFHNPSWSISTEVFAYIIFSLTMLFIKKIEVITILIVFLSGYYILNYSNAKLDAITDVESIIRCFYSFFMGVGLYIFYNRINLKVFSSITVISLILLPVYQISISVIFCYIMYLLYRRHLQEKTSFLEWGGHKVFGSDKL
ncbi:acyltransferase [Aliarcobacter butzleri]|uniref:acyltransferase family protein n=1 Tax=Aliarcobacter butzleri TaxID=28197 RepID=UPI0021B5672F|nr:acyltransferase [Aliarcobacter butzleri]MCT7592492.1 acyltransferase [Aliarcobacter butzleri]